MNKDPLSGVLGSVPGGPGVTAAGSAAAPDASKCFSLAMMQAVKGKCDCAPCQLLRKAVDAMTDQVLEPKP